MHFATHGALTGQVKGTSEPGLIVTPPAKETSDAKALGFPMGSEIATLKLDANWVILSACNTAAGTGEHAEARLVAGPPQPVGAPSWWSPKARCGE